MDSLFYQQIKDQSIYTFDEYSDYILEPVNIKYARGLLVAFHKRRKNKTKMSKRAS